MCRDAESQRLNYSRETAIFVASRQNTRTSDRRISAWLEVTMSSQHSRMMVLRLTSRATFIDCVCRVDTRFSVIRRKAFDLINLLRAIKLG